MGEIESQKLSTRRARAHIQTTGFGGTISAVIMLHYALRYLQHELS